MAADKNSPESEDRNPIAPPPGGGGGSDFVNNWVLNDDVTYAGGAQGYSSLSVGELEAEGAALFDWDEIPIRTSGHAVTFNTNDEIVDNITYTEQGITWDEDSADGANSLVYAEDDNVFIGAYYEYIDGERIDPVTSLISAGIGGLPQSKTLSFSTSVIVDSLIGYIDTASGSSGQYSREWDWGGQEQTTWWTNYLVRLEPGEQFTFNLSDSISLLGNPSSMLTGGQFEVEMPDEIDSIGEKIGKETTIEDLDEAGVKGLDLPEIYEGLTAYSGGVIKENPEMVQMSSEKIAQLSEEDVVYRYPANISKVKTLKKPSWEQ
ncbi:hypothetical protein [Natrialba hulunbeirensis]|nr:hypothetical protein [Natrialba hulunbeirensis]